MPQQAMRLTHAIHDHDVCAPMFESAHSLGCCCDCVCLPVFFLRLFMQFKLLKIDIFVIATCSVSCVALCLC